MATYATATNQVASLKELYSDDSWVMKDLVYKTQPFFALVPKDESPEGMGGKYFPCPTIYGTPQGRSATFSNALSNQTAAQDASFFIYRTKNYQLVSIENELMEATAGNATAFIDAAKLQIDTGFRNITNDIAADLFRGGTGTRGQIGSYNQVGAVVTIVLAQRSQVVQFEVGQTLVAMATDGGAPGSQTLVLTAVNRNNGTIVGTGSASPLTDAGFVAGGFLAVQGDVASAGSTTTGTFLKIAGLAAWLPTSVTTTDSFWGVNRSADAQRLAGVFYDGSQQSIEEALIDASALTAEAGGPGPDMGFIGFQTWSALEKEIGAKVQYVQVQHDTADIAFKGIQLNAPYGPITMIADRNCLPKTAFLLQMDTWKLRTTNRAPHILTYGGRYGLEGIPVSDADALQIRIGMYGNLTCNAPGWNCRALLSA